MEGPRGEVTVATLGRAVGGIAFTLTALGVLMIYSHSTFWAAERYHDPGHFLRSQLFHAGLAFLVFLVAAGIPYDVWGRRARGLVGFTAALLLLVLIFGNEMNGARRWLRFLGFGIQPSEIAKLAAIVWAAAFVSGRSGDLPEFKRGFVPAVLPVALLSGLILVEPDFGTALFVAALGMTILIVGGLRFSQVALVAAGALPAVTIAMLSKFEYIRHRIGFFLSDDLSHQVKQSFIALGSGGLLGKGVGAGTGKLFYLPEVAGDFIFPAVAEELGYVGVVVVIGLFMAFAWCGWRIFRATLAVDVFGALLALGVTIWISLQALVNLAVVSGAAPTKGIALPFISYGGSSLVVTLGAVGILVNVARTTHRRRRLDLVEGAA